jgi:hypothetical protein
MMEMFLDFLRLAVAAMLLLAAVALFEVAVSLLFGRAR